MPYRTKSALQEANTTTSTSEISAYVSTSQILDNVQGPQILAKRQVAGLMRMVANMTAPAAYTIITINGVYGADPKAGR